MNIKKIIVDNFRNIKHAEYDLQQMNVFAGPNGTGKSNTLLAIYWLLNDYLLDGSSDDASNKPYERDQKTKTSVYLEFEDGWNIRREYFEKWTKKQTTKEIVMEGNMTQYYIRGDKVNVKEAREQLKARLHLDVKTSTSSFDMSLALSDPLYIGSKVDSNVLRSFIIDLVGDVKNDDVFKKDPLFETIRKLITEYDGDSSLVIKALKKKIAKCKEDVSSKEGAVETLQGISDVSIDELTKAEHEISSYDELIEEYKHQKVTNVNKQIEKIEKEIAGIKLQLSESINSDNNHLITINEEVNKQIENKRDEYKKLRNELNLLNEEHLKNEKLVNVYEESVKMHKETVKNKMSQLEESRNEYTQIAQSIFVNNIVIPDMVKCPECGHIMNKEVLESVEESIKASEKQFEIEKANKIEENIKRGKKLKLDIDNYNYKIEDLSKKIQEYDLSIYDKKIDGINQKIALVEKEGNELKQKIVKFYTSDATQKLRVELSTLEQKLQYEKSNDNTVEELDNKIFHCIEEKKPYTEVISKHDMYEQTQKEITRINKEIDTVLNNQTEYEQKLSTVSEFLKTKLSMLNENVESVFGTRLKFTLVKTNIKEGSWDEVCYPSVLDKATPFSRGSESERIRAGIYMIECIKKKLNMEDIPIIFDRSNDLDSHNLKNLETNAQIITTRVDDVHFQDVSLVYE